jgi:molybdenum cofactor biosynthesis protein B
MMSGLNIAVLTISDTRVLDTDESGKTIVEALSIRGHRIHSRAIVADEVDKIRAAVAALVWSGASGGECVDAVICTGGTGITRRDVTPEAIEPLVTKAIPGFGELFRMLSYAEIGASTIQSRAFAALCGDSLVFALPGSTRAVRLALERIIVPQLDRETRPCNFAELLPRIRGVRP